MSGHAPRLCVLAAEESGDVYAAELVRTLKALDPQALIDGVGGPAVKASGARLIFDAKHLGGVGFIEAHNKLSAFYRAYREISASLASNRYDVVVCIDCPELNLRLARYASRRGLRVVYYVTPQIWAWRSWRAKLLRKYVELCLVVLPFEVDFYRARRVKAEFVGHPLVDLIKPVTDKADFLRQAGLDPSRPVVGLLPGSRRTEIRYNLPTLRGAAEELAKERPDLQFLLPVAHTVQRGQVEHYLEGHGLPLVLLEGKAQGVMSVADLCLIVSGTATLEAALLGCPMVMIYKGSYASYKIVRLLSPLSDFGLPNLVAGRRIVPELVQDQATPEAVAREALDILQDPARRQHVVAELGKVRSLLGDEGAAERAARRILEFI